MFSCSWIFDIPWTVAQQAPLSIGFPRQKYWNRFSFPTPEDLLDPGIEPPSPILQADSLPLHYQGSLYRSISSVQFIHSVVSNSLRPHESQHARPPCPSPTPRVHSDSRPSSQWCHPAVSSSVVPFSSCPQSLPASVFSSESTLRVRWPIGHHNLFWGGMVWIRGSMFLFYFNEF